MKYILALLLLFPVFSFAQSFGPGDTVFNNVVSMITATSARVNGNTLNGDEVGNQVVLKYVRVGHTDTTTGVQPWPNALFNLTGLVPSTQYVYYYAYSNPPQYLPQIGRYYFTTLGTTTTYAAERATVFPYTAHDSGLKVPRADTSLYRTPPPGYGSIVFKKSDSTFYGYRGDRWIALGVDSAGIMPALNLKVDSVTVTGDSLFYYCCGGVAHGYILPINLLAWKTIGNTGTDPATNFIGTTDNIGLLFKTNNIQSGYIDRVENNTSFGVGSMVSRTTGSFNTAVGRSALTLTTTGDNNSGFGESALGSNTTGSTNTAAGAQALELSSTGSANTGVGSLALNAITGDNNIGLGAHAGKNAGALSNQLFISSIAHSTIAQDSTRSIVYGVQNTSATDQRLYINAQPYLPYLNSAVGTKALRINPGTGLITYADTTTGGVATNIYTADGTLTANRTVNAVGRFLRVDSATSMRLTKYRSSDSSIGRLEFPSGSLVAAKLFYEDASNSLGGVTAGMQIEPLGSGADVVLFANQGTTVTDVVRIHSEDGNFRFVTDSITAANIPLLTSISDTTANKPLVIGSDNLFRRMDFWPGGGASGLTVGTTTITGGTNTRVLYNNSGVVGEYPITGTGNVMLSASPTSTGTLSFADGTFTGLLQNIGSNTTSFQTRVGSFLTQSYALNNGFISDNAYFNGSSWTRNATGYASGFQFYNGQLMIHNINTGTGAFTQQVQMKSDYSGKFGLGVNIASAPATYTGATFYHDAATGFTGINDITPSASLDVTGGVNITDTLRVAGESHLMGNVGVGTDVPGVALDVVGEQHITGNILVGNGSGEAGLYYNDAPQKIATFDINTTTYSYSNGSYIFNNTSHIYSNPVSINTGVDALYPLDVNGDAGISGKLGIGAAPDATGNLLVNDLAGTGSRPVIASSTGVLSAPVSDRSAKQNIRPLNNGLTTLMKLRPVSFEYKDAWKTYGQGAQIGFIAQDIKNVLPNSTFVTPSTGKMGYNEIDLVPILVKAVQEQQKMIDELKEEIKRLQK